MRRDGRAVECVWTSVDQAVWDRETLARDARSRAVSALSTQLSGLTLLTACVYLLGCLRPVWRLSADYCACETVSRCCE